MSFSRGSRRRGARQQNQFLSRRRERRGAARWRGRCTTLSCELLEDRLLLAITAAIPPGVSNGLDFLLSVTPDEIKDVIPAEISNFPGTSAAYQAFPQEVNEVSIDGNAFNFFLLIDEGGQNVPILRVGPAITEDLVEEIKVGVVDLVGDVEFPVAQLAGFDLPSSSAIVPNPQAILQFFPFLDDIASGINSLLDFGVPDITIPEVRFPALEIPDLGLVCPCEIIPEFTLIPETTLFPGFTLADALPDSLVDLIRGITSFIEDVGPGGIYVNTLDGDDTIDASHLTGTEQVLFGGTGNDMLMPGGGEQLIEALGLPGIAGVAQPSINVFGGDGRDTIVVNRRFNVDDFHVDGGPGNDVLLVDASDGNDIIELVFDSQGVLSEVRFLAPNPSEGAATNATQRLSLPTDTVRGSFTLTFDDGSAVATTGAIAHDASASDIQTELESLANVGAGNVRVSGLDAGPWTIEFLQDLGGQRVSRLVPDGANLVRRGWDPTVVRTREGDPNRGTNEMQRITLPTEPDGGSFLTGGTFTLAYSTDNGTETTAPIGHRASRSDVRQALEALPSIEPGDVRVVGVSGGPWMVEFQGNLALTPQPELIADGVQLTGGVDPTISQINGAPRVQTITLPGPRDGNASLGGSFSLSFDNNVVNDTTAAIPWNASAATVREALDDLASIGSGNVTVTGPAGGPWEVALSGLAGLAGQPLITAIPASLTGGVSLNVEETATGSGVNEVQRLSAPVASGGTFRLTFDNGAIARTTGELPFDATVGELQTALESLASIGGAGNVIVSNTNGGPWDIEFTGELAASEQAELTIDGSNLIPAVVAPQASELQAGGGGDNEIQQLSAPVATGGDFALTFNDGVTSETTAAIPFDAEINQVATALEDLTNIGSGNVDVTGSDGGPWTVEFVGGGLEETDLPLLTVDGSGLTGLPVVSELVSHVDGENEVQRVSLSPPASGGDFTLTFENETTTPLSWDATAAEVQAAMEELASLRSGEVEVTSPHATGGPWHVEFTGCRAATDVPLITGDSSALAGGFTSADVQVVADTNQPGVNERQTITMPAAPADPQAGSFRLSFNGGSVSRTTADIPHNATASQVEDALEALENIGAGDVVVTSPNVEGGPWSVEFTQDLASTDLPLMSINPAQLGRDEPIEVVEVQEAGPTNELQTVTLPAMASGGTFTLQFDDGDTVTPTAAIPFDASPADVQTALEALPTIDSGDLRVRGGVGDPSVREIVTGSASDNETQKITLSPLAQAGTFTLTFSDGVTSETTSPLDFDAEAQAVQDALELLPNIGDGHVLVSGDAGGPFDVEFVGALATSDQPLLAADGANLTQLENGPWEVEFVGQFAAEPQQPLVADGTLLELTGLNPRVAELTQGSDGAPLVLKTTKFSSFVSVEQLRVNGNGGDDQLIVRGAPDLPLGIIFDGGDGVDEIELISKSDSPSFVSPIFPDDVQGVLTMDGQKIQIADVEGGVSLNAGGQAGTVVFSGTDEANDMRFAGVGSDAATIARDGQVTTTLNAFERGSSLIIRGEQGDDVISIAPNKSTVFEDISVFGGGPSGADALLFEGNADDDVFVLTPSSDSVKGGTMVINGSEVRYDGIEEVGIEGLEGIDSLTVHEPAVGSNDNILFKPGVANDGSFQFTAQPSAAQTALAYHPVHFGSIETREFNTGTGKDTLTASTDDLPGVNSHVTAVGGDGVTMLFFGDQPTRFTHDIDIPDVLSLEIGTANDRVTIEPGNGVDIAVNTSVGDDTLVFQPPLDEPVYVDLGAARIEHAGFGDVTFTSVDRILVEGNGNNALTVRGLPHENRFAYEPRGSQAGRVTVVDVPSSVAFTGIGGKFSLLGSPAVGDEVRVLGSNAEDAFLVDLAVGTVRARNALGTELKELVLDPTLEIVKLEGGSGDDLFRVSVPDEMSNVYQVHVDGGPPDASDRLVFVDAGTGNLVLHREGPGQRSGSISIDGGPPTGYENIERVDILPVDPLTGGTGDDGLGRIVVFDTDVFEHNDNRRTPTPFEDLAQATRRPNIDPPAQLDPFGQQLPGDEDWYRFVAPRTATMRFELLLETIGELSNGAAGLPADGQLRIDVYSSAGDLIDRLPAEAVTSHTVGVEQGMSYLLRVRGAAPEAVNVYELDAVNTDEVGPRITDVFVTGNAEFDLFDPKPSSGPTPPVNSLTIRVEDPVARRPGFLYEALNERIAGSPGHYRLVGDHSGLIAIDSVTIVNEPRIPGELATASIRLSFSEPLPDDRFTLTVADNVSDPVGNLLDGESNADTPRAVTLPSGDGVAGGNFAARFTVDSRPEVAVSASTRIYVDTNGNFIYDPEGNGDSTNTDLMFRFGLVSDSVFSGNFAPEAATSASGFEKLGAFGFDPFAGVYRFLLDFDHNGVADFYSPVEGITTSGLPVAGDFALDHPGDEIGLFMGDRWYLDTNGDNMIDVDADTVIYTDMRGIPVVGDVNGDGSDDLITYDAGSDTFFIDLDRDGGVDDTIEFGIPDFVERPVVGDLNLDGIDDLGLWVAGSGDKIGEGKAEWHFLISDHEPPEAGPVAPSLLFDEYSPDPLGNDLFAHYGDRHSLPIFGNFDPPVAKSAAGHLLQFTNQNNAYDVNADGFVSPIDALLVINALNSEGATKLPEMRIEYEASSPYLDVSGDDYISPIDALFVIDRLNNRSSQEGEGEALATGLNETGDANTPSLSQSTGRVSARPEEVVLAQVGRSSQASNDVEPVMTERPVRSVTSLQAEADPLVGVTRAAPSYPRGATGLQADAALEEVLDLIADDVETEWWKLGG